MNDEKPLSKNESLELITQMISEAKRGYARGGSFYFLLWGWVVLLANLGHYVLAQLSYSNAHMVWLITIPAAIASSIYGARQRRTAHVQNHLNSMYGLIWLSMLIGAFTVILSMEGSNIYINGIVLTFAAIGTFLSGSLLRFKALIFGAVALWVASILAFFAAPIDQFLIGAAGILAGYLIPGYMLKKAEDG